MPLLILGAEMPNRAGWGAATTIVALIVLQATSAPAASHTTGGVYHAIHRSVSGTTSFRYHSWAEHDHAGMKRLRIWTSWPGPGNDTVPCSSSDYWSSHAHCDVRYDSASPNRYGQQWTEPYDQATCQDSDVASYSFTDTHGMCRHSGSW